METAQAELVAHCLADQDHGIITCDDTFCELLGRERREIVGSHPLDLTHPLDRGLHGVLLDELAKDGGAFSITKCYVRGDGELIWVSNRVAPVRDGIGPALASATSLRAGSPVTSLALARNVSAARRLCMAFLIGKECSDRSWFPRPVPNWCCNSIPPDSRARASMAKPWREAFSSARQRAG